MRSAHSRALVFCIGTMLYCLSMTLDAAIMLTGALTAALPFLGFPHRIDSVLVFVLGAATVALGIALRRRANRLAARETFKKTDAFVEHNASHEHGAEDTH